MQLEEWLSLSEAARAFGKSRHTLRAWIREEKLQTRRRGTAKNAPVLVSRAELVSLLSPEYLAELGSLPGKAEPGRSPQEEAVVTPSSSSPRFSSPPQEDARERLISALEGEKDRLVAECQRLQDQLQEERNRATRNEERLDEERERSHSLQERVAALERELASLGGSGRGIWGLLETGVRRVIGVG